MVTSGDLSMLDMKTSWDGSATSGGGGIKAGMLADPAKIAKEREREERVRQARERLEQERKKKLEELKEQQRQAQENRERQLEMRRQKIEDLRKRDTERRAAVEERRRMKEEIERLRKESILQKAEERVARYEAWRAGGRKGNLGTEGSTPKHLSVSTSVLYSKRHSDFSSSTTLSHANRPESSLGKASKTSPSASMSSSYHAGYGNTLQPSPVRIRERSSPRKQRPASVATSMPSFVGGEPAKLMTANRSKSSDRMARDRSKTRPSRKKDKSAPKETATSKGKDKKGDDKDDANDEKDGGHGTVKKTRVSLSFFDRLATPKFRNQDDQNKESPPKKESPIVRKSSFRDKTTSKEGSTTPRHVTHRDSSASSPRTAGRNASPATVSTTPKASPRITPPPTSTPSTSTQPAPHTAPDIQVSHSHNAAPSSEDGTTAPRGGVNQDITEEAYKAKMAEKRRQAREKAEKEAEEERKRQEEERLAEEERQRQEEEEQLRLEEETIRLAEEARKAEEERLQRAIEAEEKRKKEEAEKLEQEKKAKEEADRKAKEEAERIEREKQEKSRKDEEERMERKKKLEMIMKRVKTEPTTNTDTSLKMESPKKSPGSSPNRSALASPEVQEMPPFAQPEPENSSGSDENINKEKDVPPSSDTTDNAEIESSEPVLTPVVRSASSGDILDSATSEDTKEMEKGDSLNALNTPVKSTNGTSSSEPTSEVKSRFKSPLLQQLVENKGGSDSPGTPKFKSPLLQNLLGKTKVGARMGLSASMGDLSLNKDSTNATTTGRANQGSSPSISPAGSSKEISKAGTDEDKDVDESVGSSTVLQHNRLTNGIGKGDGAEDDDSFDTMKTTTVKSSVESSPKLSPLGMVDSALGSSMDPQDLSAPDVVISNGYNKDKQDNMDDSSISLHYQEDEKPLNAPATTTTTTTLPEQCQSGQSSSQEETEEEEEEENRGVGVSGQFEDYIDLLDNGSNSKASVSLTGSTPIIAFEENSLRTADFGESLS